MILVDEPRYWPEAAMRDSLPSKWWCHMVTDADSFDELHAMADRIGMKREWFQGDHYDLTPKRREVAIREGAIAVTAKELVVRRLRKDGTHGIPKEGR